MTGIRSPLPYLGASDGPAVGHGVHSKAMREPGGGSVGALKAPFPWFGGKSRVAPIVWQYFGNVANYVEPFAGSLAVLLARPHDPRIETVNDLDCYIANFWRATTAAPEEVARFADAPVNEADLHARHRWLVDRADFRERMRREPEYFDAKIAGWWVWGLCAWIGSGWCTTDPAELERNEGKRPTMGGGNGGGDSPHHGKGVHALGMRLPAIGGMSQGEGRESGGARGVIALARKLPNIGGRIAGDGSRQATSGDGTGVHAKGARSRLHEVFAALSERLRYVRVACGDWRRVLTDSVTWRHGSTAVFLDPPYADSERTEGLYACDSGTVAAEVRAWALEHGADERLRIALCGYEGEHVMPESWACVPWKAKGGYGGQRRKGTNVNPTRERVWFSPGCLRPETRPAQGDLFAAGAT